MSLENSIQLSPSILGGDPITLEEGEQEILLEPVAPILAQSTHCSDTPPSGKKRLITSKPHNPEPAWTFEMDTSDELILSDLFPEAHMGTDDSVEFVEVEDVKPATTAETSTLDKVWSGDSLFQNDELVCCNPFEVEGRAIPINNDDDDAFDLLKFVVDDAIDPYDPHVQSFIQDTGAPEASTIDLSQVAPSTSSAVIKEECPDPLDDPDYQPETPVRRGRGRPRVPRTEPEPPRYILIAHFFL